MQDVAALEVARLARVVHAAEQLGGLRAEHGLNLARRPQVEFALFAFAVGILAAIEAAQRIGHVAEQIVERLPHDLGIARLAGGLPGLEIADRQRSIVVQHFLEVRHEPPPVDAVAVKTTTQMIEQPALGHVIQGRRDHFEQGVVARAAPAAQQPAQGQRLGELRRRTESALLGIERLPQGRLSLCARRIVQLGPSGVETLLDHFPQ